MSCSSSISRRRPPTEAQVWCRLRGSENVGGLLGYHLSSGSGESAHGEVLNSTASGDVRGADGATAVGLLIGINVSDGGAEFENIDGSSSGTGTILDADGSLTSSTDQIGAWEGD